MTLENYTVAIDSNPTFYSGSGSTFTTWPYTYSWSYPEKKIIYMYQITCPKPGCKTQNWMELDMINACKKCGSTIKVVTKLSDYEVEVD